MGKIFSYLNQGHEESQTSFFFFLSCWLIHCYLISVGYKFKPVLFFELMSSTMPGTAAHKTLKECSLVQSVLLSKSLVFCRQTSTQTRDRTLLKLSQYAVCFVFK